MAVQQGSTIRVSYEGKLKDGTIFDASTNHGSDLEFQVGNGMLIAGFEEAVVGMTIGQIKEVIIPPSQAYGERREELVKDIPRSNFPGEIKEGMGIVLKLPNDQEIPALIMKVTDQTVTLDLNHSLAGQELHFTITLTAIVEE